LVLFVEGTVPVAEREEVRRIAVACAEALGLQPEWLRRRGRTQVVALARHLTWWLVRRRTVLSYPQIGRLFGRHYSTVVTAVADHGPRFEQGGEHAELTALLEARLDAGRPTVPAVLPVLVDHDPGD
jgi:hypothetical protein